MRRNVVASGKRRVGSRGLSAAPKLSGKSCLIFPETHFPETVTRTRVRLPFQRSASIDLSEVLKQLPAGCALVGGQAVAWWAGRYEISPAGQRDLGGPVVEFWGDREAVQMLANRMGVKPLFPHAYEMATWTGAIPLEINGRESWAFFLHSIAGLDVMNPIEACVAEAFPFRSRIKYVQVLSPVSLVLTTLHALRHFEQKDRQHETHLKSSLQAAGAFLSELLELREVRHVLWNIERLISAHGLKAYRHLEEQYEFNVLSAIPIEDIRKTAQRSKVPSKDRERLVHFLERRWNQVLA